MPYTPDFQGLADLRAWYLSEFNRTILRPKAMKPKTMAARVAQGWNGKNAIIGADTGNIHSLWIMEYWAASLPGSLGAMGTDPTPAQSIGARFEGLLVAFLNEAFLILSAAGFSAAKRLKAKRGGNIAEFDQFHHLGAITRELKKNRDLEAVFGRDYRVKPDVTVYRERETEASFGTRGALQVARWSPFFEEAQETSPKVPILEAIVSCKSSIRSDRSQNIRTEAASAIKMRKGKLPRVIAVTAEPMCGGGRLESIALGGGEIDCVYHVALPELLSAMQLAKAKDELPRLETLIKTRRIRDVSDLPFDLIL